MKKFIVKRLNRNHDVSRFLFLAIFSLLASFISTSLWAKTYGKEEKIEEKELIVSLYVMSIGFESSKLTAVEFIWVPSYLENQCLGKSYISCRDLEVSFNLKNSNAPLSRYPTRISDAWVGETYSSILPSNEEILRNMSNKKYVKDVLTHSEGEHHFNLIASERKVRALVHWERWTNGEGFKVLKIIEN